MILLWGPLAFLVAGFLIGVIMRRIMPTYERGCLQYAAMALLAALGIVVVGALLSVVSVDENDFAGSGVQRRIWVGPLLLFFAVGVFTGRFLKRRATISRRTRTARPAVTHDVPPELRSTGRRNRK